MRRGRVFILLALVLIVVLAGAAIVLPNLLGSSDGATSEPGSSESPPEQLAEETVNVVITTQRVARGEEIEEGVIQLVAIPQDRLIEGMFVDSEDVFGKIAKFDLDAGVFLTSAMVVDFADQLGTAGSDAALLIDPGMVAVSIPISRLSSVAYGLRRGDSVNVIVTMLMVDLDATYQSILPNNSSAVLAPGPAVLVSSTEEGENGTNVSTDIAADELLQTLTAQIMSGGVVSPIGRLDLDPSLGQPFYVVPSEPQRPRAVSQTLVQNAMVLQVGTFPLDIASAEPVQSTEDEGNTDGADDQASQEQTSVAQASNSADVIVAPDIITLVVTPQDAVTLNYLLFQGAELSLALRSPKDDSRVDTEVVTLQFLVDQYNISPPAKLPYGLEPRIDELIPPTLRNDIVPPSTDEQ